jgi:hypothetical protein
MTVGVKEFRDECRLAAEVMSLPVSLHKSRFMAIPPEVITL